MPSFCRIKRVNDPFERGVIRGGRTLGGNVSMQTIYVSSMHPSLPVVYPSEYKVKSGFQAFRTNGEARWLGQVSEQTLKQHFFLRAEIRQ